MRGARGAALAFVLSFVAYLAPVIEPEARSLLGQVLVREIADLAGGEPSRSIGWGVANVATAMAFQLLLGLLVWWFARRPGWLRGGIVLFASLPAVVLLNVLYLFAIPMYFLLEADTMPERAGWAVECAVRDVGIPVDVQSQVVAPKGARSLPIWVVEFKPPYRYGLLELPLCRVTPLALTHSMLGAVTRIAADGRALYATAPGPNARRGRSSTPPPVPAGRSRPVRASIRSCRMTAAGRPGSARPALHRVPRRSSCGTSTRGRSARSRSPAWRLSASQSSYTSTARRARCGSSGMFARSYESASTGASSAQRPGPRAWMPLPRRDSTIPAGGWRGMPIARTRLTASRGRFPQAEASIVCVWDAESRPWR